jgi:hypothetical protein
MFRDSGAKALSLDESQFRATSARDEAVSLITRYPNLSEAELARLIHLYRRFSALDMALAISNEKLAPNLDRFSADHRSKIRTPFRQYAALVGYAVVTIAALTWAASVAS